jgi:hypothetical protein
MGAAGPVDLSEVVIRCRPSSSQRTARNQPEQVEAGPLGALLMCLQQPKMHQARRSADAVRENHRNLASFGGVYNGGYHAAESTIALIITRFPSSLPRMAAERPQVSSVLQPVPSRPAARAYQTLR